MPKRERGDQCLGYRGGQACVFPTIPEVHRTLMDQHPLLTNPFFAAMINTYFIKRGKRSYKAHKRAGMVAWIARGIP
jgi:hypothetical protein